jgi:hypothetical protein
VTKVKGHTTAEDVAAGKISDIDHQGNDEADTIADEGVRLHGGYLSLAAWYRHRHGRLQEFMQRIHKLNVEMIKAERTKREEMRKQADPFTKKTVIKHCMPMVVKVSEEDACRRLVYRPPPIGCHKFQQHQEVVNDVHDYLTSLRWTLEDNSSQAGVSWLELLILFELRGGRLDKKLTEDGKASTAAPLMTTSQELHFFKSTVRYINENCLIQHDRIFWEGGKTQAWRLQSFRWEQNTPTVRGSIHLPDGEASSIAEALLCLKVGKLGAERRRAWTEGRLHLPTTFLKLNGTPPWRHLNNHTYHKHNKHDKHTKHYNKQQHNTTSSKETHRETDRTTVEHTVTDHFAAVYHPSASSSDGRMRTWTHEGKFPKLTVQQRTTQETNKHANTSTDTNNTQRKKARMQQGEDIKKQNEDKKIDVEAPELEGIDRALARVLQCPKCGEWRCTAKTSLRSASGWAHITCTTCKIQTRSKGWKCQCSKEWFLCKLHVGICSLPGTMSLHAKRKKAAEEEKPPASTHQSSRCPEPPMKRSKLINSSASQRVTNAIDVEATRASGQLMAPGLHGQAVPSRIQSSKRPVPDTLTTEPRQVRLRAGSALALRFPNFVQSSLEAVPRG